MGLKNLMSVISGKSAESVTFESRFDTAYRKATIAHELKHQQSVPTDYFRPSSIGGCERMLYFMRMGAVQDTEIISVELADICNSGTDRHTRLQQLFEEMEELYLYDIESIVVEANLKGINTEFMGWNSDHTEARCKNEDLSIFFQPDGVARFNGKDVILEIKTESTYQFKNRYEPKEDHIRQATCYAMGLGFDWVLFIYEDRNFCVKKYYLIEITNELKQKVIDKVNFVNSCIKSCLVPDKDLTKCTYCRYTSECKSVG